MQVRAIATKLSALNGIQNGGRAILHLLFFVDFGHTIYTSGSSRQHHCKISLTYVNRRLSYCYCAKIQDGGRRHLEFIIFVHFGHMFYFRWQPSALLPGPVDFIFV